MLQIRPGGCSYQFEVLDSFQTADPPGNCLNFTFCSFNHYYLQAIMRIQMNMQRGNNLFKVIFALNQINFR